LLQKPAVAYLWLDLTSAAPMKDIFARYLGIWATYHHVLPHSRGGTSELQNAIIVCQPCNCARMHYTLDEVGLLDPRLREPTRSAWDGLERFH
jgi:5-methylcytosine-specific restriction endonuclease McrA